MLQQHMSRYDIFAMSYKRFFSSGNRIPFILTSIVAVIMTIQSTTKITSNSYFAWLFPVYLLNIIPAIVADTLIFRYSEKKKEQFFVQLLILIILRCVIPASIVSSVLGGLVAQRHCTQNGKGSYAI